MSIVVFGLTGGIASGKSTVAKRFAERGLAVIDADQVARDVVVPGSEGLAAVVAAFGQDVLAADGTLNRAALRERIVDDPEARRRLEGILHPRIGAETMARAAALAQRGVDLACYEAALLVENGLADSFRPLVVVAASVDTQRARLMERDGMTAEAADKLIATQLPLADKIAAADFVIENDGTREELLARADEVLDALEAVHGSTLEADPEEP
ncbi:MAG TPA: dephospho-CoA kinase [Polyangiaceae bacterium]|nr:dephospho-CoA kinase [Polyangiaceae bacterium]